MKSPSLWPSGIGSRLGRNRLWVQFLAVSDIYPMFLEPTITWAPSELYVYIWLDTKIVFEKKLRLFRQPILFWLQSFSYWSPSMCPYWLSSLQYTCSVSSGDPEGSVVGALLFFLFVSTISLTTSIKQSPLELFADDLKIYTDITFPTSTTSFQNHLNLIHSWSLTWQLGSAYSEMQYPPTGSSLSISRYFPHYPFLTTS